MVVMWYQGENPMNLFNLYSDGFGPHKIIVEEVGSVLSQSIPDIIDVSQVTYYMHAFYLYILQLAPVGIDFSHFVVVVGHTPSE